MLVITDFLIPIIKSDAKLMFILKTDQWSEINV